MDRNGSSLHARRAARRRRKPTWCRSDCSKTLRRALAQLRDWAFESADGALPAIAGALLIGLSAPAPEHAPQHVIALDNVVTQRGDDVDEQHRGKHIGEDHMRPLDPLPHRAIYRGD